MKKPIVWTIAGSDSGGGAGIQADLKTATLLGTHACSIITALTAQNTSGTTRVDWAAPEMIRAQLSALQKDLPPAAVKLGMLGTADAVGITAAALSETRAPFTVCDPVLISSSGTALLEKNAWPLIPEMLFPVIDLFTPNIPEAELLLNIKIQTPADVEAAAEKALALGVREMLMKGGHGGTDRASDYWTNGREHAWLSSPRIHTHSSHGTGCVLSSAIAAARARGCKPLESTILAKAYLNQMLRQAPGLGRGCGPLAFHPWERAEEDLPMLSQTIDGPETRAEAPRVENE